MMLDHLLDFIPEVGDMYTHCAVPVEETPPGVLLNAQNNTADWLESLGVGSEATEQQLQAAVAQEAFVAVTAATPSEAQNWALLEMKTPLAVRHLVGMLTAYDWAFVERAKELRGYAVAKILEETKHPDSRIRLKALDMLGRVTEVALFTDRVEIKKTEISAHELDEKIKEKLRLYTGVNDVQEIEDVEVVDGKELDRGSDEK